MDRLVIQPQPSPMTASEHFARIPRAEIERSTFDRSHVWKGTIDAGYLVPVFVDEMLPGDTFSDNMSAFGRLATPNRPFLDNLYLDTFCFFVPNRLLWEHWREMNGQQANPDDPTNYEVPILNTVGPPAVTAFPVGSVFDYMGLPIRESDGIPMTLNVLPLRAYNLIWNEWFRDQNLQDSVPFNFGDGPDDYGDYVLLRRGKRKDYFTGALPWPQKEDPILMPLGSTAPVVFPSGAYGTRVQRMDTGHEGEDQGIIQEAFDAGSGTSAKELYTSASDNEGAAPGLRDARIAVDLPGDAYTLLSSASAATVNMVRTAFQMQRLLERDARGGTRYTEIVRSHFGVVSPDARLQRPELLGTGETRLAMTPIPQTSASGGGSYLGDLGGAMTGTISNGHGFTYSATEHGIVMVLASIRADLNYQYGINRMWSRRTRWDYYWPALSHLGEQQVNNQEIFWTGSASDLEPWGYQERYAEYRYKPSQITGLFRSNAALSLDIWHLALDNKVGGVPTLPELGANYIQDDPPIDRVIQVPSQPHFLLDVFHHLRCARPMPVYSVPGLVDHM